ncbi:MAG: thioredoxin [Spirochaetales bacterium]|nr:thioredoxin [Spirochaetales bacterium]
MATQLTKDKFLKEIFDFENNKEWKFEGKLPAVIDFYADWCQPCKMVAPIIEELSTEYEGKVNFFKVDTEAQQELAGAFGIQSIPSLLFIPVDGKPQMAAGALPKESFIEVIEKELLAATGTEA